MIDQFGREVRAGDTIVWATCRMTKFRKHHLTLKKGKVVHVDVKPMGNGHIAETLLVERDLATQNKSHPAAVLLIDPDFVVIEGNSS